MREQTLFIEALEREDPLERAAFLEKECAANADLRRRIEKLLQRHEQPDSLLDTPSQLSATVDLPRSDWVGTRIGPYQLMEQIGEGGMGVVYVAEQTEPVRRKVALKIIKPGMDSRQVIARFDAERQALALMDHPNIAKVLDAGATQAGGPYFVMELVKGTPITQYCDEHRLTPTERLELFIPVCQAIQHAHQKGIIHRDLKPSNILVGLYDGNPTPKIIDFGVAKAMGQKLTEQTLYTGFGTVIGTPEYMSPEQAQLENVDIDTRSDIYSLGVLLYELLTGTTPLQHKRVQEAAVLEVLRLVREEEPPRPSSRLTTTEELPSIAANRNLEPRKLTGLVHGDLDWIVMKCLEKDRARRYETATSLASDLSHYLNSEPVQACPPSTWYRLRRFARRNRAGLATTAVLAAALLGGTAVSTWRYIAEQKARKDADRRATEAREVVDFWIIDMIGAAAPSKAQGQIPTVDEVLDRADERVEQKFADQPLIEAAIRLALGRAYEELGQFAKAERHADRAVALRLARLGPQHVDTIDAQNALGWIIFRQPARNDEVQSLLSPVLETARKALGPEHKVTLQTMHVLAANLSRMNKLDEARLLHEELVTLKARVYGPEDIATLATMSNLASLYARAGEPEKAKQKYEQVFAILDRDHPDHPNTIRVMRALADIYSRSGQAERAIDLIRRSAYAAARVMGTSHPDTQAYIGSAIGVDLASGSRDALERSLTVQGQSLDQARHDFGEASKEASRWTFRQAETLVLLDRCDDAMALLQGLPVDREPLDISGVRAQTRLAVLLRNQRRLPEAQQLLHRSHEATTRLRRETPQPNQEIEQLHSFAGFLLERWPGHSPGVDRSEWPPSPLTIDVPFRATSPVADGRIEPAEYGPGLEVTFDDDANPGRLYSWMKAHPKTPDDLSVRMHVAYTKRSLFLAFRVRDQYVDAGGSATAPPWENDSIDVVIDGDCVANDQLAIIRFDDTGPPENSEGFQVEADAGGRKLTGSASFSNADWKAGTSRTADGYIIEFEVPLVLIDTRDGPEYDPVAAGDEIRFNFGICDQDDQDRYQQAYGTFWAEDPGLSPTWGGEDFWTVRLRLVPNHVPGIPSQNDQPKPSDHDDPIPTRVGPPRREDE